MNTTCTGWSAQPASSPSVSETPARRPGLRAAPGAKPASAARVFHRTVRAGNAIGVRRGSGPRTPPRGGDDDRTPHYPLSAARLARTALRASAALGLRLPDAVTLTRDANVTLTVSVTRPQARHYTVRAFSFFPHAWRPTLLRPGLSLPPCRSANAAYSSAHRTRSATRPGRSPLEPTSNSSQPSASALDKSPT